MLGHHKEIDIEAGDLTYGQRIELGRILSDATIGDVIRFKETFKCLYGRFPATFAIAAHIKEYDRIIQGVKHWIDIESQMLHYEPTQEELQAGVEQYHQAVGELSTLHSIARSFSVDPDVVYNWKYSKVFGILLNDLESYKYQQRLNKIYQRKK